MKYFVISKKGLILNAQDVESMSENFKKFVKCEIGESDQDSLLESNDSVSRPLRLVRPLRLAQGPRELKGRLEASIVDRVESKKPEYLKYASKLGFNWEENAGAGLLQYDYKANFIMNLLREYARNLVHKIGFPILEVSGSNMFDIKHPVVEAYANLYGEKLFKAGSGKKKYVMSYDASYSQFNLAAKYNLSHRDLPFAHFSISDCYRFEQRGELMMFYRQRRFFMPDLHPYFKDINQAFEWYPKIESVLIESAKDVNRDYQVVVAVSSIENFEKYKAEIKQIAINGNRDILIEIREDGQDYYWIINVDYKIIDKSGHSREIACIQIDIGNAERLGIEYSDENGVKRNPVIIHSAVPGGLERFLYMIFDDFKNSMPLWLYPIQIRLIPVSEKFNDFCIKLQNKCRNKARIDIDDRAESVSRKIKEAHKDLIPYSIVIGEKELNLEKIPELENALEQIKLSQKGKPFAKVNWV